MIGFSREDTALLYRLRDHNRRRRLAAELEERAFREEVADRIDWFVRFSIQECRDPAMRSIALRRDAAVQQDSYWCGFIAMCRSFWDRHADRLDGIRRVTGIEVPSRDPRSKP